MSKDTRLTKEEYFALLEENLRRPDHERKRYELINGELYADGRRADMSAMPQPEDTRLTKEEYFALLEENLRRPDHEQMRYELIDGELYAMAGGAKLGHVRITTNLAVQLRELLSESDCEVFGVDMSVRPEEAASYTEPDCSVVCGEPEFDENVPIAVLKNPTLLVEVLSPSTSDRDRGVKFNVYRQIESLQHYLMVSQSEPAVELYTRRDDGWHLMDIMGLDAQVELTALGVTLPMADIYARVDFEADADDSAGEQVE